MRNAREEVGRQGVVKICKVAQEAKIDDSGRDAKAAEERQRRNISEGVLAGGRPRAKGRKCGTEAVAGICDLWVGTVRFVPSKTPPRPQGWFWCSKGGEALTPLPS